MQIPSRTGDPNCRIFPWQHKTLVPRLSWATRGRSAFVCKAQGYAVLLGTLRTPSFSIPFQCLCVWPLCITRWWNDGAENPWCLTILLFPTAFALLQRSQTVLLCWVYRIHPKASLETFGLWTVGTQQWILYHVVYCLICCILLNI